ncbi:hypothetical protein BDFB_010457 [Asbolus verrucosus]|uniref:Uncharacterized protein n=1 Tax=Asbolus verrucosus TaxID=1661398 RepID=A0A482WE87_ASBVE|nr:hypothetical protein BDFB_010457 [Asbolus verrucosus]
MSKNFVKDFQKQYFSCAATEILVLQENKQLADPKNGVMKELKISACHNNLIFLMEPTGLS